MCWGEKEQRAGKMAEEIENRDTMKGLQILKLSDSNVKTTMLNMCI